VISVTSILVRSYDLDHLSLAWSLNDQASERVEEYDFFILRSIDGAAGPFRVIAGPFYNTYRFRDGDVQRLHKWRTYFYKIRMVHRATGREQEFGPEWLRSPPDRIALEIQRREALLWKEFAGRLVYLFPRLTFGQRCKHCWDQGPRGNTIAREVTQNCASCFDSTFVGGFAKPMSLYMQFDASPIQAVKTDTKEFHVSMTTARTIAFPPIQARDMIVEAENRRWCVERVSTTEKGRAVIRQELSLKEYMRDDIVYAVPIMADEMTLHNPAREMTRPMDLQNIPDGIRMKDKLVTP
jgi:hypothetical protein